MVNVALAAAVPIAISPEPAGANLKSTFVSPCAAIIGPAVPVAAFVILTSLTAEPVTPKVTNSLPLLSAIYCPSV